MGEVIIKLKEENGKLKITTSGIPESGNLSELEAMGSKLAKMAENFTSEKSLLQKIFSFLLG